MTPATTSAAAAHRQNTAKPAQGANWGVEFVPWRPVLISAWPALDGRNFCTAFIELGSRLAMGGNTKTKPKTAAIAPAVLRIMVPRPRAKSPRTARYMPVPTTVRSTFGAPRVVLMPFDERID